MTGHVRIDKETNKYMYVIEVGPKGNRKRKVKKGFNSEREAKKAMNGRIAELLNEEDSAINEDDITVGDYLDYWLAAYAKSSTAPNTYKGYETIIRVHLKPDLGEKKLRLLTPLDVQSYYKKKLEGVIKTVKGKEVVVENPLSKRTVKHHHRLLCKALNDAMDWEFIHKNVATKAKPPKPEKYKPTIYSEAELKRLYDAAKQTSSIYYPIIFSAGHTGARLGELRALQWKDIDFDTRKLYITKTAYDAKGEGVKIKDLTKNGKDRYVVMGKRLMEFLKNHQETYHSLKEELGDAFNPLNLVFYNSKGNYFDPRDLSRAMKVAIKKAGLPDSRFHDQRHSHATILLKRNVHPKIASDRLGHSKSSFTSDTYSHVIPSLQDGAADIFDQVFDE